MINTVITDSECLHRRDASEYIPVQITFVKNDITKKSGVGIMGNHGREYPSTGKTSGFERNFPLGSDQLASQMSKMPGTTQAGQRRPHTMYNR